MKNSLLLFMLMFGIATAQDRSPRRLSNSLLQRPGPSLLQRDSSTDGLIDSVARELRTGASNLVDLFVGTSLSLSIPGDDNGIVSANQAKVILREFFDSRKVHELEFSQKGTSERNPYATGRMKMTFRNTRESYQVYISFTRIDRRWILWQLNVY